MKYDTIVNDCYNLYTIETDKFKTCHMEIIFRNACSKESISLCALLFDVLLENSSEYKTKKMLARKLQDLYNLNLYAVNSRVGDTILSNVVAEFLDPIFMDENSLENIIELAFNTIFKPNVTNGAFDEETFKKVKKRLELEIDSIKESPKRSSILNAFKCIDETSPRSFNSCGDKEI